MALESLSDTPPPLVSKGNNDSDTPANSDLIKGEGLSKDEASEGGKQEIPAEELEDGEIDDDGIEEEYPGDEEYPEHKRDGEDSEEWDIDPDEARRIKKREKNRQRRKRRKEEKRMQALQAWAMAMAAGEMVDEGGGEEMASDEGEEEMMGGEEQQQLQEDMSPKRGARNFSPKKRKQQRKRQRAASPSESDDEEFSKLLKQEMSRHKLKVKSSDESSPESRRMRSPGRFDSGGDAPINLEDEESEDEYESMHRSKKKKRKKHKHHHRKHSSKKMHRGEPTDSQEEENDLRMLPPGVPHGGPNHGGGPQQGQDYMDQEPMSEQDQQIMHDHQMGKVHVPKTHLICKFYLENKCKKGLDCSYTHEGSIPKRPEQCKFYLQGFCSKGPLCMFLHKEYPCKYFHTGQICYSEDKCRFSHAPLTEELKELVENMKKEQAGLKGRDRDSDQAPLLPSPERQNNVPFQKGNPGGKPPKKQSRGIPSLFDIHVQPVGEKGQIILEKERRGLFDLDDRPSYMEEEEGNMDHPESSDRSEGLQDRIGSPMGSPRQHNAHKESPASRSRGLSRQQSHSDTPSRRPSLPAPNTPVPAEKKSNSMSTLKDPRLRRIKEDHSSSTGEEGPLIEVSSTDNEGDTIDLTTEESEREQKSGSNSELNSEMAATKTENSKTETTQTQEKTNPLEESSSATAGTTEEGSGTESEPLKASVETTKPSEQSQEKKEVEPGPAKPAPAKVVKPPKSMPAKSKALFMRIQQNQSRTDRDSEGKEGSSATGEKETDGDDNWYSSDEDDSDKKASDSGLPSKQGPHLQLKVNLDSDREHKVTPSTISPEASNRGPLLSSVLKANNKQNNNNAQASLPGPLASLFSNSQAAPGGGTVKTPPLPLNILDLVTKGTSSVQKSTSPKVQDLFAGILPQRKASQDGYRLLDCIKDPNLKDPRLGRERKSKKGMVFRVLRWKRCEYSVTDADDRPTLPPIELTTPTELRSPPAFPAATQSADEARTQAMVDVIKKVINEVRNQPADPRTQNPANNPQMAHHDPRAFPNDPRTAQQQQQQQINFPPGHMGPPGLRPQNMGPYGMQNQPPIQQHGPHQRPPGPGPGFVRHPMGLPNQSFTPRMLRPPQVPTGFSHPRFGQQGPRGPRPARPERMQHRPNRPILQPPFGSPTRGGPPHADRMPHPPGPRFGNPRMEMRDAPIGDGMADPRDPRTGANRVGVGDPRLARRGSTTDIDMRVKDPRLARMQQGQAGTVGAGDIDMRQLNSPPGHSSTSSGRVDPRQASRANPTNDVDLRQKPPGQGGEDSGIPLKDMFKGRDPTASPFV